MSSIPAKYQDGIVNSLKIWKQLPDAEKTGMLEYEVKYPNELMGVRVTNINGTNAKVSALVVSLDPAVEVTNETCSRWDFEI
jgi:hypothetical protein